MASVVLHHNYQCDQCGTPEIVAVPLLYQQGTRTFSGTFNHGTTQSYSAQAVTPPRARSYVRPILLWGFVITLFSLWSFTALSAFLRHPTISASETEVTAIFLFLWLASLGGMVRSLRKISRYNREVYPQLHWDWAHTYMCRRCGKLRLIPS
jgi:hypothetical protein